MTKKCLNKAPGFDFFRSFCAQKCLCCDSGLTSFLQGDPKSFHSTFIPQSKKHWVLQDWCPVYQQQRALDNSGGGSRWWVVQERGRVLESGVRAEHEISL